MTQYIFLHECVPDNKQYKNKAKVDYVFDTIIIPSQPWGGKEINSKQLKKIYIALILKYPTLTLTFASYLLSFPFLNLLSVPFQDFTEI